MVEIALRQSLILSQGSFLIFFHRPITGALLALALFMVISPLFRYRFRLPPGGGVPRAR
jgi:TctA family transporter